MFPLIHRRSIGKPIEPLEARMLFSIAGAAHLDLESTVGSGASTVYTYDVTLTNAGTTNIGTFWFAWEPGSDFLPSRPSETSNPTGWTNVITGSNNSVDGSAIEWSAGAGALLAAGQSLSGFEFSTVDSPSTLAGKSPTHSTIAATSSFVYIGAPFNDPGSEFVATVNQPSTSLAATTTTLSSSAATTTAGTSITLTAAVATTPAGGATPSGAVSFLNNGTAIGSANIGTGGIATLTTASLPTGTDVITAVYGGDSANASSTSSPLTETITAAGPVESASAQVNLISIGGTAAAPVYNYDITVTDTGTTTIGTYWFAWTPGNNFLPSVPSSEFSPAGWGNGAGTASTPDVTGPEATPDGTGLRWVAQSTAAELAPGQSLSGFAFLTTDTPIQLSGSSPSHPTTAVGTSFIYSARPFSDAGVEFTTAVSSNAGEAHLEPSLNTAKLPTNVVAGSTVNATTLVTLANLAGSTSTGATSVTLFAAPDKSLDGSQIALATATRRPPLRAGASATVPLRIRKLPASLTDGTYTLIAAATDAAGATLISTSTSTLIVAPPTVALSATLGAVTPASVSAGKTLSLFVSLTNTGNTISKGPLSLSLQLTGSAAISLGTIKRSVTIKPNSKPAIIKLHVRLPASATAGVYALAVDVTQGSATTSAINNAAVTVTG